LTGLALLLQKPIRPSGGSGHLEAESDDEDSAEGRFFDLERAMDLVAKVRLVPSCQLSLPATILRTHRRRLRTSGRS